MSNIGYINFDGNSGENSTSTALSKSELISKLFRSKYVLVKEDNKEFIGRIIEGPFYKTEEVGIDSAMSLASILRGDDLPGLPEYYATYRIEVIGEYRDKQTFPISTRPLPKSAVIEANDEIIQKLIGIKGDMKIGTLSHYDTINVAFDSNDKKVLPRNIGIFGTVGSGKSNTAQVIIEEALKEKYSVILFDVEGEYINMDKPTDKKTELLKIGLTPKKIDNFQVYCPAPDVQTENKGKLFGVTFEEFDHYILFEIMGVSEAQEREFQKLIESNPRTIDDMISKINSTDMHSATKRALTSKLFYIKQHHIFDVQGASSINAKDLLTPSQLTVFDVSNSNDHVKNITIVDILKKVFDEKDKKSNPTKILIVIEEAHTFISREHRDKMVATIDMLKMIARRGRKRWLSLCFVSQQPSHIPSEIFELSNTRIIHSLKSEPNIQALKNTTDNVLENIWKDVSNLAQGQALVVSPQFSHPIFVQMRLATSMRKFQD